MWIVAGLEFNNAIAFSNFPKLLVHAATRRRINCYIFFVSSLNF